MLRAGAVAGAAALVAGLLSVPLAAQAAPEISVPSAAQVHVEASAFPAGTYIVTLKDAPVATYTGGVSGYARTRPAKGKQLNAHSGAVTKYATYLKSRQASLTTQLGITPLYTYTTAYSGFSAKLTSEQATRLAKSSSVSSVIPDSRLTLQESHSLDYLDVSTAGGTWDQVGGVADAGKGVVVGDIDSGIAPENPSFAGSTLTATASATVPYLSGGDVKFDKSDGQVFSSPVDDDSDEWTNSADLSTKIIAAHYYVDGYEAGIGAAPGGHLQKEYLSPRDGSGHGSHTASTAAGDHSVAASVKGRDFGTISGVAPAAKIAVYKICWTGPDGDEDSDDDGCYTADALAAIDQAVTDGVDVLNYSIGGGSAQTTYSATDAAFLNAAAAGVFVAAAAGNDGPDASTLDNAAPWETTVAASTIPDYEATAELGNGDEFVGAGISVTSDVGPAPLVLAVDNKASGASVADANLCKEGSLASVTGKIVVCDRGDNSRLSKSDTVAAAGGIGMILVNVPGSADDVDNDFHSVPSVHIVAKHRDAIRTYAHQAGATATLVEGNQTPTETTVPQIAGFSSHGPVLAAGSDVLKPDIAAPGVSILAAVANAQGADPEWDFYSGTSMATPHIAGLAAVYLGEHPSATPAEIKSAMMTGATDLVDADGGDVTDAFTQGAGQVQPKTYLDAGLYYPAGLADWESYLVGADQYFDYSAGYDHISPLDLTGVEAIDPSDLNQASIAIGDLPGTQTVKRSVTSLATGTYTASVDLPGIDATVSPSTLSFDAVGQTKSFTVTFTRTSAPLDDWTTGFLTWTSAQHTVRSPLALHPDSITAPAVVSGTGTTGSTSVTVTPGLSGTVPLSTEAFAKRKLVPNPADATLAYSGVAHQGDAPYKYAVTIPEHTSLFRADVDPTVTKPGTDVDLYLYPKGGSIGDPLAYSATDSANESFTITDPDAGEYVLAVDPYAEPSGPVPFALTTYTLSPSTSVEGSKIETVPATLSGTHAGQDANFTVRWTGLAPDSAYLGLVHYADYAPTTEVDVTTGATIAPTNTAPPTVSGTVKVGSTVTVDPGTWTPSNDQVTFGYQWTADGAPIGGATDAGYTIPAERAGQTLAVIVTAANKGDGSTASASAAAGIVVPADAAPLVSVTPPTIGGTVRPKHTVTATTGTWSVPNSGLAFGYQWTADGKPIAGATGASFAIPGSLAGHSLTVVVTAHSGAGATAATSAAAAVKWAARTTVSLSDPTITTRVKEKVTVKVKAAGSGKETGTVIVHYGSKKKKDALHASDHGKIVVTLPKLKKGHYKVWAEYRGNSAVSGDDSPKKNLAVRRV